MFQLISATADEVLGGVEETAESKKIQTKQILTRLKKTASVICLVRIFIFTIGVIHLSQVV